MRHASREIRGEWIKNDRKPILTVIVRDEDGALVNLTGLTLALYMYGPLASDASATVKVNYSAMVLSVPASGEATYSWASGDLDTAGVFMCRVRIGAVAADYEHLTPFFIRVVEADEHPDEAN